MTGAGHLALTAEQLGLYLNFNARFMKTWITFQQKKMKLQTKQHFVEDKTEILWNVLKIR
jgi:hypothetical protein